MKITFLGTSHGVPEPHRQCTCIMVEAGKNVYFLDMGTSPVGALRNRGICMDAIKGVFITHMHGDHTNGLIPFVDVLGWYFKTPDPVICLPDLAAADLISSWLKTTLNNSNKTIKYKAVQSGEIFNDGTLKVTAFSTLHCPNSYAYLLETDGKSVLFTGDLQLPRVDFPRVAETRRIDLLICEAAHFPATEYLPVLEKCDIGRVCVTHYSPRFHQSVFDLQEARKDLIIATDDLELHI